MDLCLKNAFSRIENSIINFAKFIVQILLKFVVQNALNTPRDEAWKNKGMDRSTVPKRSRLCWHKCRIFLCVVRGWAEDPLAGF